MAVALLLSLALLVAPAAAQAEPHFTQASAHVEGIHLVVSFQEVGLEPGEQPDYGLATNALGEYACTNRAGKPVMGRKYRLTLDASGGSNIRGIPPADASGVVNGEHTFPGDLAVDPGAVSYFCYVEKGEKGWGAVTLSLRFSNILLADQTHNVTVGIAPVGF
jgi:hypothetical protein